MSCGSRKNSPTRTLVVGLVFVLIGCAGLAPARAGIVVQGSFGPNGDLGFVNSPANLSITFGGDGQGQIVQMDGFINVTGQNLNNGSGFGTSAQMTYGPPSGLNYTFSASQPTADQLVLTYQFVNNTGASLPGFQFLPYINPFFGFTNPNDFATVGGAIASSPFAGPTSFQVGDSSNSTIFTNVLFGTLDNVNSASTPIDGTNVAMALGFSAGTLGVGQSIAFQVLLSDDGSSIGSLALTDQNPDYPGDSLTMSGQVVPEPSAFVLLGVGSLGVLTAGVLSRRKRAHGSGETIEDAANIPGSRGQKRVRHHFV